MYVCMICVTNEENQLKKQNPKKCKIIFLNSLMCKYIRKLYAS